MAGWRLHQQHLWWWALLTSKVRKYMFAKSVSRTLRSWLDRNYFDSMRYHIGAGVLANRRAHAPDFRDLWEAEVQVFSQWGEDGIIDFLFDCLAISKPKALELGVGNFKECNTRFLAEHRGASVVAVDAREDLPTFVRSLPAMWRTSIWPMVAWITPESAAAIQMAAREWMGGLDLISLDIDGNDYWVAQMLDFSDTALVVVEYNALFGQSSVTVPRNDSFDRREAHYSCLYFGASIRAWVDFFQARGFALLGTNRVGSNAFFCNEALLTRVPLPRVDTDDLSPYVDWRVRESRDVDGKLSFSHGEERVKAIQNLPVVHLSSDKVITVGEAVGA